MMDPGTSVCDYRDQVYRTVKGKPILLANLLSSKCLEPMKIGYEAFLVTFANAVIVDYDKNRKSIHVTDPNGTDLTFSIENRRVREGWFPENMNR
jgi:leucyl aminopeptidase (aminopeptidase T)